MKEVRNAIVGEFEMNSSVSRCEPSSRQIFRVSSVRFMADGAVLHKTRGVNYAIPNAREAQSFGFEDEEDDAAVCITLQLSRP